MASPQKSLRIGVFLGPVQFSDIVGIDLFGNTSKSYFDSVRSIMPGIDNLEAHVAEVEWFYISTSLEPQELTPRGLKIVPSVTFDDCPRDLDIVIIGGPFPTHRPEAADRFMKEAWESTRVW